MLGSSTARDDEDDLGGTGAILAEDPTIFTFSIHGEKNFPFKKERSDLDVGLPDGTEDEEYHARLAAFDRGVRPHKILDVRNGSVLH